MHATSALLLLLVVTSTMAATNKDGFIRALAPKCKEAADCNDNNDLTLDTCEASGDCFNTLCPDSGDCTGTVNENGTPDLKDDDFCDLICPPPSSAPSPSPSESPSWKPSNNPSTSPSVNPSSHPSILPSESPSANPTACVPQDACSVASYNEAGECIQEVKDCNDNDLSTIDVCSVDSGCQYIQVHPDMDFNAVFGSVDYIYEDKTSLSRDEEVAILNWIKTEVTQMRTPFCWKQSYGRGAGYVLSDCPAGKEKIGALCYSPCRAGYSRQGTFDCQQECKAGWRDDGLFCRLAEYGRGLGFAWQIWDGFSNAGMISRCEAQHGKGNCEPWGAIWYPKCKPGYKPVGCCVCRPDPTPNCRAEGYNGGFDLSCAVKIELGDPTPLQCAPHLEQGGLLCYPPCKDGFNGVGPVCWQQCDTDQADCGAGCASSSEDCALAIVDQVFGPLIVAANILTFGFADAVGDAVDVVQIGSKLVKASTGTGRLMLRLVNLLQTIDNEGTNFVRMIRDGIRLLRAGSASNVGYGSYQSFGHLFAENFAEMTSEAIASTIDSKLSPIDALHIKMLWATEQLQEMKEANDWFIADTTLAIVGLADPTGVVDLVAAYTRPICLDVIPFPTLEGETNAPPEALCKPNVVLSADASCRASPDPEQDLDDGSYDPEGSLIERILMNSEPFDLGESYATMEVVDYQGASASCDSLITVVDNTPPVIECTQRTTVPNDAGKCSAVVHYEPPVGEDNCDSITIQIAGLPSGSTFQVGTTLNEFEVTDGSDYQTSCGFNITVMDTEPPTLSCEGLAVTLGNDPGSCSATYSYTPPVGVDNCETTTNQFEGPEGFVPYIFPVGATTSSFQATDPDGNYATCSFDVTIRDVEDPTIFCPADAIRVCDDVDPSETGVAEATDNCHVDNISYSDDTSDDIAGNCAEINLRTWTATDEASNAAECVQKIVEIPAKPDAVTTSSLCVFDMDTDASLQQFRAFYVPDRYVNEAVPRVDQNGFAKPPFTFAASNPEGFAYNVFHFGTPGETASFALEIPYPFVTANAGVKAYDWLDLRAGAQGEVCYDQGGREPFFSDSGLSIELSDYGGACGDSTAVTIDIVVPESGFVHLVLPLELGLTKKNPNDPVGDLILPNYCSSLTFSVSGASAPSSATLENVNIFKNNPSLVGFVFSGSRPVPGSQVTMVDTSKGKEVDSALTDEDGFYVLDFQATGKATEYAISVEGSEDATVLVTLQNNDHRVISFQI